MPTLRRLPHACATWSRACRECGSGRSHAQRDLFEQILLDTAVKDGRLTTAQQMLELRRMADRTGWRSTPRCAVTADSACRTCDQARARACSRAPHPLEAITEESQCPATQLKICSSHRRAARRTLDLTRALIRFPTVNPPARLIVPARNSSAKRLRARGFAVDYVHAAARPATTSLTRASMSLLGAQQDARTLRAFQWPHRCRAKRRRVTLDPFAPGEGQPSLRRACDMKAVSLHPSSRSKP